MLRRLFPTFAPLTLGLCLLALCCLAGCGSNLKTKEKVQQDLLTHLQQAGFDTKSMDIDVSQVTFDNDQARAAVSFRPKGATNIHDGMTMNYTMKSQNGHWVVIGRADSQGHGDPQSLGGAGSAGGGLPEGHPQLTSPDDTGSPPLPPGHPQIPGGSAAPSDGVKALPAGHPKISLYRNNNFKRETVDQIGTGLSA